MRPCFSCQRKVQRTFPIPETCHDDGDMDVCEECLDMLRSHVRQIAMASYRAQIQKVNDFGRKQSCV